jgi:hypothetical protein
MLLIMNIPLIGLFTRMLTIPLWFLVPAIAAVSAVGVYAVHSTTFDLFMISSITLAISRAAISPQTISGCSVNIAGPGVMHSAVVSGPGHRRGLRRRRLRGTQHHF